MRSARAVAPASGARWRRAALWIAITTLAAASALPADVRSPDVPYDNFPYDGSFTFARIKFEPTEWGPGPYFWGWDLKWNHDYPWAEQNFMKIIDELTTVVPTMDGGNIYAADDPELLDYPWAYICEVGFWNPTDSEVRGLRNYLLKGGFLILDDFEREQWYNMEAQLQRALPELRLIEIGPDHPIFSSFFRVADIYVPHAMYQYRPSYFALFENNDPGRRIMALVNFNSDLAEYWEWSDQSFFPIDLSNEAYKLGVNYFVYGLTH